MVNKQIITQSIEAVNFILADGVYPYDDPEDKFVVIIDGAEVAWASTQAQAWRSYNEMLRCEGEHFQRCPGDYIPFDGLAPETDGEWADDYGLGSPL
jgi:hypothetical protein